MFSQFSQFGREENPDTMAATRLEATARACLEQLAAGQVPYNTVYGGSVGCSSSGKAQTQRSVMGEPFDGSPKRVSTVGPDEMVRHTKTHMLDLERTETTSLMERAVRSAAEVLLRVLRGQKQPALANH